MRIYRLPHERFKVRQTRSNDCTNCEILYTVRINSHINHIISLQLNHLRDSLQRDQTNANNAFRSKVISHIIINFHRSAGLSCPMHGQFCPKRVPFCP